MTRIFISYRRAAAAGQAGRLYDRLRGAFGERNVFMDVDNIPAGETFESFILSQIERCDVFLVVLSQGTLDRVHSPTDWVRREVAYALTQPHVRVIPILVDGFPMPDPDSLPDDMRGLTGLNGELLIHTLFEETSARIIRRIRAVTGTVPKRKAAPPRWLIAAGILTTLLVVGVVVALLLAGGRPPTAPPHTPLPPLAEVTPDPRQAVIRNADWTPYVRPYDGVEIALVPAGCFEMGSLEGLENETPVTERCFDTPFWIDRYEVTNAQYRRCVEARVCAPPSNRAYYDNPEFADHPVVYVDWFQAGVYAAWRGGALPTEAQWEYAARGPDSAAYPWGGMFDGTLLNFCDVNCTFDWRDPDANDAHMLTAPVGSYDSGESWVGALDMSGNVWEWTTTRFETYPYTPDDGREIQDTSNRPRVLRGGSWFSSANGARAAFRLRDTPFNRLDSAGFRVVYPTA
jgi:formylglycine-generating enzyme required for sulfatase activity